MCVKINWRYLGGIYTRSKVRVSLVLFLSLVKAFRDCCISHKMDFKLLEFGVWKESPTLAVLNREECFKQVTDVDKIVKFLSNTKRIVDLVDSSEIGLSSVIANELKRYRLAGLLAVFQFGSFTVRARLYPLSEVAIRLMSIFREFGFRPPEIHLSLEPVEVDGNIIYSFYDMFRYAHYSNFLSDVVERYFNILFDIHPFRIATLYGIRSVNLANFVLWIDFTKSIETTRDILNSIPAFRRKFSKYFFNDVFRVASRHKEDREFSALNEVIQSVKARLLRSSILKSRHFSKVMSDLLFKYYLVRAVDPAHKVIRRIDADKLFEVRNVILIPKASSSPSSSHIMFNKKFFKLLQLFATEISERGVELLSKSGIRGLSYKSMENLFIRVLDDVATKMETDRE